MGTGCEIRRQLTIAATKAKPTATYIQTGILSVAEVTLKIKATNVVPSVCPSSRAVPCIPFAPPLRERGAADIIVLLFGVWNRPKPIPQSINRQAMSISVGCPGNKANRRSPVAYTTIPIPPNNISRSASRLPERSRSSLPAKESTAAPSPPHFCRLHFANKRVMIPSPTTVP